MPNLDTLPLELVTQILAPFSTKSHESDPMFQPCLRHHYVIYCSCLRAYYNDIAPALKALARVNLVSKRLHHATTPLLYHTPTTQLSWRLVRTLIERPDLGKLVSRLYVSDCGNWRKRDGVPGSVRKWYRQRIRTDMFGIAPGETAEEEEAELVEAGVAWLRACKAVPTDLLSSLCPNLVVLKGSDYVNTHHGLFWKEGMFSSLKTVYMWRLKTGNGMNLGVFEWLFRAAPGMQRLQLRGLEHVPQLPVAELEVLPFEMKEVKRVDILCSRVEDACSWENIVKMFPNMETLLYQPRGTLGDSEMPAFFQATTAILEALANQVGCGVSSKLRVFDLDLRYMDWNEWHGHKSEEEIMEVLRGDMRNAGVECVVSNPRAGFNKYYVENREFESPYGLHCFEA